MPRSEALAADAGDDRGLRSVRRGGRHPRSQGLRKPGLRGRGRGDGGDGPELEPGRGDIRPAGPRGSGPVRQPRGGYSPRRDQSRDARQPRQCASRRRDPGPPSRRAPRRRPGFPLVIGRAASRSGGPGRLLLSVPPRTRGAPHSEPGRSVGPHGRPRSRRRTDEGGRLGIFEASGIPCLVKGGRLRGGVVDVLYDGHEHSLFIHAVLKEGVHGTGCCLSSAALGHLARGHDLVEACRLAIEFVHDARKQAVRKGRGRRTFSFPPRQS